MGRVKNLVREVVNSFPGVNRQMGRIVAAINELSGSDILHGVTIEVTLTSGSDTTVQHLLGRVPNGYFPVYQSAAANIFTSTTENSRPQSTLILDTDATHTARLWVF